MINSLTRVRLYREQLNRDGQITLSRENVNWLLNRAEEGVLLLGDPPQDLRQSALPLPSPAQPERPTVRILVASEPLYHKA